MTVSELIEYLQTMPQDMGVVRNNDYSSNTPYTYVPVPKIVFDLSKQYVLVG